MCLKQIYLTEFSRVNLNLSLLYRCHSFTTYLQRHRKRKYVADKTSCYSVILMVIIVMIIRDKNNNNDNNEKITKMTQQQKTPLTIMPGHQPAWGHHRHAQAASPRGGMAATHHYSDTRHRSRDETATVLTQKDHSRLTDSL